MSSGIGRSAVTSPPLEAEVRELHLAFENANRGVLNPVDLRQLVSTVPEFLVHRVFGFGADGWLEAAAERPHREREALLALLGPMGPLFTLLTHLSSSTPSSTSWLFEFPVANLPPVTRDVLSHQAGSASPPIVQGPFTPPAAQEVPPRASCLAPFAASRLHQQPQQHPHMLVTAVEYFLLCLVSSAAWKNAYGPVNPSSSISRPAKPNKRSSSLPSRRALYNQLLTNYLRHFFPLPGPHLATPRDSGELILRAALDCWLTPPSQSAIPSPNPPATWIPTIEVADALAQLIVHLTPPSEVDDPLLLRAPPAPFESTAYNPHPVDLVRARAVVAPRVAAFYDMVFTRAPWGVDTWAVTYVALCRGWGATVAPWSRAVLGAVADKTLPKKRGASAAAGAGVTGGFKAAAQSPGKTVGAVVALAASAWEHLPQIGGDATSPASESLRVRGWEGFVRRRAALLLATLPHVLRKAATVRMGSFPDGCETTKVLACALGNDDVVKILVHERERMTIAGTLPPVHDLWTSLRDLTVQIDDSARRKSSTAESLRRPHSSSVLLSPFCVIYNLPALPTSSYMQHMTNLIEQAPWGSERREGSKALGEMRKGLEAHGSPDQVRRQLVFGQRMCSNRDVAFEGGPWDAPIRSDEITILVALAYWLSLQIEKRTRWKVNLRFIGSYSFLVFSGVFLAIFALIFFNGTSDPVGDKPQP